MKGQEEEAGVEEPCEQCHHNYVWSVCLFVCLFGGGCPFSSHRKLGADIQSQCTLPEGYLRPEQVLTVTVDAGISAACP